MYRSSNIKGREKMAPLQLARLRKSKVLRDWVSQTNLSLKNIIAPYFVVSGKNIERPIKAMPGIFHLSVDRLLKELEEFKQINAILLFSLPESKNNTASQSYKKDGIIQKAIQAVKKNFPWMIVISDVCLCGYTLHGHCGIIENLKFKDKKVKSQFKIQNYKINEEKTREVLAKIALSHAESGADLVAPSAMVDCQVKVIRQALDKRGFNHTGILAYSAKYASNFYGPFREALNSAPVFDDRKTYQLDFRNSDEALREIECDLTEGADIVMVKPALSYLDIIHQVKEKFKVPIAAYSVSGEYSMIKKFSQNPETEKKLALEILTSIKRAGADFIITYWAKELKEWLKEV